MSDSPTLTTGVSGRYDELDGLRALSVLGIIAFHVFPVSGLWFTVNLFFVLSGFFITTNLSARRCVPLWRYFGGFYGRRAARIFPLYFFYVGLLAALYALFGMPVLLPKYLLPLLTFTYNFTRATSDWICCEQFTHLWSLSVEVQFYLLWAWVVKLCPARLLGPLCGGVILLTPVWRFGLSEWLLARGIPMSHLADCLYWSTLGHLDAFAIGGLVAIALRASMVWRRALARAGLWLLPVAGAANITYLWVLHGYSDSLVASMGYPIHNTQAYQHIWAGSVLTIGWGSLVWMLVSDGEREWSFKRLLRHPWLVDIGRISYGMYVWHWLVLSVLLASLPSGSVLWRALVQLPATVAITYLIATYSYRYVESPMLRRFDFLTER